MTRTVFFCIFLVLANSANSAWPVCLYQSADEFGLSPQLLLAIAQVESSVDACAVNQNTNGSEDVGLMQINSWWLPKLGIQREHLFDPCLNVRVGAWILSENFSRYGQHWKAVGAYNAGTANTDFIERRRQAYAHKVADTLAIADLDQRLLDTSGACF